MKEFFLLLFICSGWQLHAQKFFTKDAKISFYSAAPLEKIEAHNKKGVGILNAQNSTIEFSLLLKGFQFEKALMQEHFNENYVESDKYPKATFKGVLKNTIDFKTDGSFKTPVEGVLTLHGVSKPETAMAVIIIKNGVVSATADFKISLADYKIKIPAVVNDKVSKTVSILIVVPSFTKKI